MIVNLVGEDLWYEVENNESRTAHLLLEGDDGVLNDLSDENLMDEAITNEENIFECWRNSAVRQEDNFIRHEESKRSKQRHEKNSSEIIHLAVMKSKKLTSFYSPTTGSSNNSTLSSLPLHMEIEELSMDKIMQGLNIEDAEGTVLETEDILKEALLSIEADSNFSIPESQKADKKLSSLSKYEFVQRRCIKSYLNLRVTQGMGKWTLRPPLLRLYVVFNKSASKQSYRARAIREWSAYYLKFGQLRPFHRGKFIKTFTIITNEVVQNFLRTEIRELKPMQRSLLTVMNFLNSDWLNEIPRAPTKVSESTARRWMYFLDFRPQEKGKNYFVDGHERIDDVQHRGEFLNSMGDLSLRCYQWEGSTLEIAVPPTFAEGEKRVVFIVQDESLFYTNDSIPLSYMVAGEKK